MKDYDPATVRVMWDAHKRECKHCAKYNPQKTATLALVCNEGAPLIKGVLEMDAAPRLAKSRKAEREMYKQAMGQNDLIDGEPRIVSKHRLRQVTRYVGD